MDSNRTYSVLSSLPTLEERFDYLALRGGVASATFGSNRWLNQDFYRSPQWRRLRRQMIVRDNGCDLGVLDHPIPPNGRPTIHHLNPLTPDDIINNRYALWDPENLITCSHDTHNAIHYGDASQLPTAAFVERYEGDHYEW